MTSNNSPSDIGGNITINLTASVLKDLNRKIIKLEKELILMLSLILIMQKRREKQI